MLNHTAFYPIAESDWRMLFEDRHMKYVEDAISDAYMVHFWKHQSRDWRVLFQRRNISYVHMASEYCSDIFKRNPGGFFVFF